MPTPHDTLSALASELVDQCPDLRQTARELALQVMAAQGVKSPDPDQIYWHRFNDAVSSPLTFTGWAHYQTPAESLTLVELVMRRFTVPDQINQDSLSQLGGFYTEGASAESFDEHNEVRLLPIPVMKAFWAFDIKHHFITQAKKFWATQRSTFRAMAKANFLAKALEARQQGDISDQDLDWLLMAVNGGIGAPATRAMLDAEHPVAATAKVWRLSIGQYSASDLVVFQAPEGHLYLYAPGKTQALQRFNEVKDLHWWLLMHNRSNDVRSRFVAHFALADHLEANNGLNAAIDQLYFCWGNGHYRQLPLADGMVNGDLFSHLTTVAHQRMLSDAELSLRSNGELRERLWISSLNAFNKVFGPLAMLDWPIALAVVGADIIDMGLNIDLAVNAPTTAERKSGVIGAIVSGIDALLNGLFLWGAWSKGLPAQAAAPVLEAVQESHASLPELTPELPYPTNSAELAEHFETNELVDSLTPGREGRMAGVYLNDEGQTFIELDDATYAVRYSEPMNTWMIVDPENPFSFHRSAPVRRNASGDWELTPRPGLKGGGRCFGSLPWGDSRAPTPLPSEASAYDMPEPPREYLRQAADGPGSRLLEGYLDLSYTGPDPKHAFEAVRDRLLADSEQFFANTTLPERPAVPGLPSNAPPKEIVRRAFSSSNGLVIGEAHSDLGSKQFLIDNMPRLAKENVRTLYMEHLMTDYHQVDLDAFAQTGQMPERLQNYLTDLDFGHNTDPSGRYTFTNVVKAARANRIKVQSIDCLASYRKGVPPPRARATLRQQLMNYFAHTVIQAEQARNGGARWVALVGNTHASTYQGVAGLADLEGTLSLRVQDVPRGSPTGIDIDPGETVVPPGSHEPVTVKSDLLLRTPLAATRDADSLLRSAGDFMVNEHPTLQLVHRTRAGELAFTRINHEGQRFWIQRPQWPLLSGRRFNSLQELTQALERMGMVQAPVPR